MTEQNQFIEKAPEVSNNSYNPFSYKGRIRRTTYWLTCIVSGFALLPFELMSENTYNIGVAILYVLLLVIYIWVNTAAATKRCHDLGHNGWWQLIPFYSLWLAFKNSMPGENEYGSNPKGE